MMLQDYQKIIQGRIENGILGIIISIKLKFKKQKYYLTERELNQKNYTFMHILLRVTY